MTARAKKAKAPVMTPVIAAAPPRPLKAYYHGGGVVEGLGMARFYWPDGEGGREPIGPRITKKRQPAGDGSGIDTAAKIEPLVPFDAPQDYANVDFIVRHYEASIPSNEKIAFVQVTLRFGDCANAHHPYEVARAWARSFYVDGRSGHGVPVVSILHAPHLAGSDADAHVHLIVLPRRLSRMGWMGGVLDLGSDAAEIEARRSWSAFKAAQEFYTM